MTSDKPGLEARLQATLPAFLNTIKVIKTKERVEICHRAEKAGEAWQLTAVRFPGMAPGTERGK